MTHKSITKICDECGGTGFISACCGAELDGHRCSYCNKFAKTAFCCGDGFENYKIGDDVFVHVCIYDRDYLKENLYNPKEHGNSKTFKGKILKIIDDYFIDVKIKYRNKVLRLEISEVQLY